MECKVELLCGALEVTPVLIETLWNVKCYYIFVLEESKYSINRNIMECKEAIHEAGYATDPKY